ncbi:40S ribosomal protein S21 [Capsicum baccatum]|uniref:40S ribosomal protein S21 n=1 Tax=Capsicum baccatum TaxID=33114 RepID=A0A2G2XRP8_CAPBA|nr:40S ribosomal protein S21 [Capsicum baccatum]
MQNEEGQNMDLYIPRKCSATNRLITSKDHASVQLNVGHLDDRGVYTGTFTTFALCGFIRAQGDADSALDRLWQKKKVEARQDRVRQCSPSYIVDRLSSSLDIRFAFGHAFDLIF